jgi:hypothetical protein
MVLLGLLVMVPIVQAEEAAFDPADYVTTNRARPASLLFSKVGDSLTVSEGYLVNAARWPDLYAPVYNEYAYLAGTLYRVKALQGRETNPFEQISISAFPAWDSADVLDPLNAWYDGCDDGESPLACELRLNDSALALIMLGTNDPEPAAYARNLDRIILITREAGAIPVLYTIPHHRGKDVTPYNDTVRRLARKYKLPLVDSHAAFASLPDQGVGSDGVHLTYEAYVRWNLLTLRLLWALENRR